MDLGEQQHNQQDGGDRALDALHDEAACAQGFRDGDDVAEGDGAGDQSQEYAGDDAIAQRLQQVALEQAEDHHHHGHQQEQQGRRPDRGTLDGGEIRGLTAGAKRQIEDQRQRRGRQDIFQAAAENAAQVHLLRGGGRNQSVRYRGDVVAEGRSRYDGADHQRRRGPDQIADGVKNGADHEDGAHRGPGGEGDQAGEQKRGGHELVAQEVELNEIVCQGVHQAAGLNELPADSGQQNRHDQDAPHLVGGTLDNGLAVGRLVLGQEQADDHGEEKDHPVFRYVRLLDRDVN